ncbi:thiaminase II [Chakrabartyella piscis]|uniref:thiaminase II n=1 Tax=Chakrabartyella piscis TaxID=2918914 RepID=UPI00295870C8|nr:thiaminase II [Chakrabartyella piscis]
MFTDELLKATGNIWSGYLKQDFVKELGNGALAEEKFRFYMVQDYLYLLQYAKVFALGVVKANDEETMRYFASMVHETLDDEMNIHKTYMARLGITPEELTTTKTAFANQSYTSYMLDVSQRGDILDVLVAVLSCAWSYEMIGAELAKIPNSKEHPFYGEWIVGYTSEGYVNSVVGLKEKVNALVEEVSPARKDALTEMFVNCCKFEREFWNMSYTMDMGE